MAGMGVFMYTMFINPETKELAPMIIGIVISIICVIVAFVVELIFFKDDVKASPKKEAEIADALAADAQANSQEAGSKEETFVSPLAGELIALSDVKDEAFSSGALGNGVAIVPSEGKLYAPCDGEITTFFPTGHAVGITTDKGADILIHVGMDTVKLDGDGFSPKKVQGDKVKQIPVGK